MAEERFWMLDRPDTVALPNEDQIVGCDDDGENPIVPIVDEEYGGVIAWASTEQQASRIVNALKEYYRNA